MRNLAQEHLVYLLERSTKYVGDCWVFGSEDARYPQIRLCGRIYMIHRVSAHVFHGLDIYDDKVQANHRPQCQFTSCWNPAHIYIGSQSDNLKDQVTKGTHHNALKDRCPRGHIYDNAQRRNGIIVSRRCNQCRRKS